MSDPKSNEIATFPEYLTAEEAIELVVKEMEDDLALQKYVDGVAADRITHMITLALAHRQPGDPLN